MKKVIALIGCVLSATAFASSVPATDFINAQQCRIVSEDHGTFCAEFKRAAIECCRERFPQQCSDNMDQLYRDMVNPFHGNQRKACEFQQGISGIDANTCDKHWNLFHDLHCPA